MTKFEHRTRVWTGLMARLKDVPLNPNTNTRAIDVETDDGHKYRFAEIHRTADVANGQKACWNDYLLYANDGVHPGAKMSLVAVGGSMQVIELESMRDVMFLIRMETALGLVQEEANA